MTTAIVGYSGFVGSNLCASHNFDACYNSKNIASAYGTMPDLLVYSGVPAEMFLANKFPEQDLAIIENAIENIKRIAPRRVVLISSIAVYNQTYNVDEATVINKEESSAYGRNRRILEEWVEQNCENSLIIRLPGIYGINLKKNFIFDMIHIIPAMLTETKYGELAAESELIRTSFIKQDNGFYKCTVSENLRPELKKEFIRLGFTALNFTDSRGIFQYYHLNHLWGLIEQALELQLRLLNVAVEPVTTAEIYAAVHMGEVFINEQNKPIPHFDFRSRYADELGGKNGYLMSKEACLKEIQEYVNAQIG